MTNSVCTRELCSHFYKKIIDRLSDHFFDIMSKAQTTVVRHFASQNDPAEPMMTIHILEYIRTLKDGPRSNALRDKRELVWIHVLNTIISTCLNIMHWGKEFRRSKQFK